MTAPLRRPATDAAGGRGPGRLRRRATDALLIGVGLLLVLAVAGDLARRAGLSERMRIDRHALRIYARPQFVDPHLMNISVQGAQDLVCGPVRGRQRRRARVCVRVVHTTQRSWRVVAGTSAPKTPARRRAA